MVVVAVGSLAVNSRAVDTLVEEAVVLVGRVEVARSPPVEMAVVAHSLLVDAVGDTGNAEGGSSAVVVHIPDLLADHTLAAGEAHLEAHRSMNLRTSERYLMRGVRSQCGDRRETASEGGESKLWGSSSYMNARYR